MHLPPPHSPLFPYTTLFRSPLPQLAAYERPRRDIGFHFMDEVAREARSVAGIDAITANSYTVRSTINPLLDRKSTRLNSSHGYISYAVFCLKKKKKPLIPLN